MKTIVFNSTVPQTTDILEERKLQVLFSMLGDDPNACFTLNGKNSCVEFEIVATEEACLQAKMRFGEFYEIWWYSSN